MKIVKNLISDKNFQSSMQHAKLGKLRVSSDVLSKHNLLTDTLKHTFLKKA